MSMTNEQAEKSARLQAKLLGWQFADAFQDVTGKWWFSKPNGHPLDRPALDPFNPADMWELAKLAEIGLKPSDAGYNGYSEKDWDLLVTGAAPLEAAQAAWLKLIEVRER